MSATCSICHENECDMITDCNHSFHRRCLNRWTERRQTCPVCRHELYNEESEDDSELDSELCTISFLILYSQLSISFSIFVLFFFLFLFF